MRNATLDFFEFYFCVIFIVSRWNKEWTYFSWYEKHLGESGGCQRFSETSRSLTFSREANELCIRSQDGTPELQRNTETALQQWEFMSLYSREVSPPTLCLSPREKASAKQSDSQFILCTASNITKIKTRELAGKLNQPRGKVEKELWQSIAG